MPSVSKAQSRLMHGVASGSIKGSGVPKTVAKDFVAADKGKSQTKLPQRYDGPRTIEELYADGRFVDFRSVVIRGQRVMTCRPIFREWEVEFEAAFDPDILNRDDVVGFFVIAGQFVGLSTYRPRFGRFALKAVDGVAWIGTPRFRDAAE